MQKRSSDGIDEMVQAPDRNIVVGSLNRLPVGSGITSYEGQKTVVVPEPPLDSSFQSVPANALQPPVNLSPYDNQQQQPNPESDGSVMERLSIVENEAMNNGQPPKIVAPSNGQKMIVLKRPVVPETIDEGEEQVPNIEQQMSDIRPAMMPADDINSDEQQQSPGIIVPNVEQHFEDGKQPLLPIQAGLPMPIYMTQYGKREDVTFDENLQNGSTTPIAYKAPPIAFQKNSKTLQISSDESLKSMAIKLGHAIEFLNELLNKYENEVKEYFDDQSGSSQSENCKKESLVSVIDRLTYLQNGLQREMTKQDFFQSAEKAEIAILESRPDNLGLENAIITQAHELGIQFQTTQMPITITRPIPKFYKDNRKPETTHQEFNFPPDIMVTQQSSKAGQNLASETPRIETTFSTKANEIPTSSTLTPISTDFLETVMAPQPTTLTEIVNQEKLNSAVGSQSLQRPTDAGTNRVSPSQSAEVSVMKKITKEKVEETIMKEEAIPVPQTQISLTQMSLNTGSSLSETLDDSSRLQNAIAKTLIEKSTQSAPSLNSPSAEMFNSKLTPLTIQAANGTNLNEDSGERTLSVVNSSSVDNGRGNRTWNFITDKMQIVRNLRKRFGLPQRDILSSEEAEIMHIVEVPDFPTDIQDPSLPNGSLTVKEIVGKVHEIKVPGSPEPSSEILKSAGDQVPSSDKQHGQTSISDEEQSKLSHLKGMIVHGRIHGTKEPPDFINPESLIDEHISNDKDISLHSPSKKDTAAHKSKRSAEGHVVVDQDVEELAKKYVKAFVQKYKDQNLVMRC